LLIPTASASRPRESPVSPSTVASRAASPRIALRLRSSDIRWIRSYVVQEGDGELGTFCIYEASSEEKIREHAARANIPATDVYPVADTVVVRPDPVPAVA
jgi:uncharacterized protein DUF4242